MQILPKLCQPTAPGFSIVPFLLPHRSPAKALPPGLALGLGRRPLQCPLVAYMDLTFSPSPQRDCQNYIKILLPLNSSHLLTCGTAAFSPLCAYIVSSLLSPGAWLQLPGHSPSPCQGSSSLAQIPGERRTLRAGF